MFTNVYVVLLESKLMTLIIMACQMTHLRRKIDTLVLRKIGSLLKYYNMPLIFCLFNPIYYYFTNVSFIQLNCMTCWLINPSIISSSSSRVEIKMHKKETVLNICSTYFTANKRLN